MRWKPNENISCNYIVYVFYCFDKIWTYFKQISSISFYHIRIFIEIRECFYTFRIGPNDLVLFLSAVATVHWTFPAELLFCFPPQCKQLQKKDNKQNTRAKHNDLIPLINKQCPSDCSSFCAVIKIAYSLAFSISILWTLYLRGFCWCKHVHLFVELFVVFMHTLECVRIAATCFASVNKVAWQMRRAMSRSVTCGYVLFIILNAKRKIEGEKNGKLSREFYVWLSCVCVCARVFLLSSFFFIMANKRYSFYFMVKVFSDEIAVLSIVLAMLIGSLLFRLLRKFYIRLLLFICRICEEWFAF